MAAAATSRCRSSSACSTRHHDACQHRVEGGAGLRRPVHDRGRGDVRVELSRDRGAAPSSRRAVERRFGDAPSNAARMFGISYDQSSAMFANQEKGRGGGVLGARRRCSSSHAWRPRSSSAWALAKYAGGGGARRARARSRWSHLCTRCGPCPSASSTRMAPALFPRVASAPDANVQTRLLREDPNRRVTPGAVPQLVRVRARGAVQRRPRRRRREPFANSMSDNTHTRYR